MDAYDIEPQQLATESGVTRQALRLIRLDMEEPRLTTLAAIVRACRRLSSKDVRAADLFNLGERSRAPHLIQGVTERHQSLPPPVPSESGSRLAAFMAAHGLSPAKVAKASGSSKTQITRYMRGVGPRLDTIRKICAGLGRLVGRPVRAHEVFDLGEDERDPRVLRKRKDKS